MDCGDTVESQSGDGIEGVSRWQWVVVDNGFSVVGGSIRDGHWDASVLVFGMLDGHFWLDGLGHFSRSVGHLQFKSLYQFYHLNRN